MRKYYAPYNQQLYDFLGRDLGWSTDQYGGLSVSVVGRTRASRIITSHRQRDGEWLAYGETRIECRRNENRMQETSEGEPFVPCSFVYFWIPTHSHTFPTEHQLILHRVHGTAIMAYYTQFHTPRLPNRGPDSACHPFMYGYRCSTWSSPFAECATNQPLPVYSHTISHLVCRMRGHRRRHGARTCARTTTPDCTILSCESPH